MIRASTFSPADGFALLHPASKPRLDAARILTLSGTIALNLLLFCLLMLPIRLPPTALTPPISRDPLVRLIPPPPQVVEIVPITRPAATPTRELPRRIETPPHAEPAVVLHAAGPMTTPATDTALAPSTDNTPSAPTLSGPAPMQLSYRFAPAPAYPRMALRRQLEGTVLLQVLVDTDGQPMDVMVAKSSGHRELDEAARLQVLRQWRFAPAMRDGQPVQAQGMVPIVFSLSR